jgi:hypothetical protein
MNRKYAHVIALNSGCETLLNAQGNHFGPGRELNMGVRFRP